MPEFSWPDLLGRLSRRLDITREQARSAMAAIMGGEATPAQIAALIVSLRMKGETVEEMTGMVQAMRSAAVSANLGTDEAVDIVGTGGDRSGTFNISTTASFIAAGAGVAIAKHGNRSMSSKCGSADVLEALGVVIDLPVDKTEQLFRDTGYAFFFAPMYHPAMRFAGPVRRELGIPTVFNFLGPLSNPAGTRNYAIGVADGLMAERMIRVLSTLGAERAFVFYGADGLDELTLSGRSTIWRLVGGEISHAQFTPEDFGVPPAPISEVLGGLVEENVAITRSILEGEKGPRRDIAVINAAAGIMASGGVDEVAEGTVLAAAAIDSGAAAQVLESVISRSQQLTEES